MKKTLKRIALIFFGVLVVAVLGTYLFIRAMIPITCEILLDIFEI